MRKTDIYDIADRIINHSNELGNINELITTNLGYSDMTKSHELDRLYFLTDYIKQVADDLRVLGNEIIKDDAKWYWLMEYRQAMRW